jgi:hypothetical protein
MPESVGLNDEGKRGVCARRIHTAISAPDLFDDDCNFSANSWHGMEIGGER